ncbi:IS1634 family transposase [Anabaena sphaerica FACHB-251]|uniref:IS1634 family transposase n=1 Tax=Anabaena sphaerica FACHB-251 TaxID=2692883 RepID=A0A927A327_9NOST|nr:IS1634 family transposase [Anabaena sphaerica]MBD2295190.1 IS1634 family transposase [Anabaena sphaerica FACHB-251]
MKESQVAMQILNIDHLGIVAGIIDEMELVEEVNKIVGIKTKENLTPGQVMKAMILNGLGFLSAPLYLFDEFFVGKPTEHLIGEGVLPEHLNDDKLGRELDKYYQVGTTKIFTTVAIKAAHKFQVESKSIHLDGTSMSVEGEYKKETEEMEKNKLEIEPEMKAIEIVHGYSRDKRPDLKQFIIDMIVTGDGDIPLYLKVDSGNVDDKSVFVERLKEFKKQWTFEGISVADSALYTAENIAAMRELKWITRVPLSIKEAQNKILDIKESEWKNSQIKGYRIAVRESEYGGIKQRWIIVESELRKKSSIQQVDRQVKKQLEKAEAGLRKLSKQEFACQPDAKIAIEKLSKSWKYHQIKEIEYMEKAEYKTAGRPNKLAEPNQIRYQVTGKIETSESAIETEKIKAGRFILATNILDKNELSDEQVLEEYKAQQSNERGFRFLKDPLFFTSSVFVKTPERVEAIAMIMGLCLLVYNLAQRKLRQELAKFDAGIRNQVKKITNKPTMRWVFQMFQAVHLVIINGQKQMSNLTEEREKIVRYLGKSCSKYYLII